MVAADLAPIQNTMTRKREIAIMELLVDSIHFSKEDNIADLATDNTKRQQLKYRMKNVICCNGIRSKRLKGLLQNEILQVLP